MYIKTSLVVNQFTRFFFWQQFLEHQFIYVGIGYYSCFFFSWNKFCNLVQSPLHIYSGIMPNIVYSYRGLYVRYILKIYHLSMTLQKQYIYARTDNKNIVERTKTWNICQFKNWTTLNTHSSLLFGDKAYDYNNINKTKVNNHPVHYKTK